VDISNSLDKSFDLTISLRKDSTADEVLRDSLAPSISNIGSHPIAQPQSSSSLPVLESVPANLMYQAQRLITLFSAVSHSDPNGQVISTFITMFDLPSL